MIKVLKISWENSNCQIVNWFVNINKLKKIKIYNIKLK